MAFPNSQKGNTGSYSATTHIWDVGEIYSINVNSDEFKQLLVRLYKNLNFMSNIINNKVSGFNLEEEFNTSKQFFNPDDPSPDALRNSFVKAFNVGALAIGETKNIAHEITPDTWLLVSAIGGASNTTTGVRYPLSFVTNGATTNIQIDFDTTNMNIVNGSGIAFTDVIVVVEYLKA